MSWDQQIFQRINDFISGLVFYIFYSTLPSTLNEAQWAVKKEEYSHQTNTPDVASMTQIKELVEHKLGIIPVFVFLNAFIGQSYDWKNPQLNVDKALLFLYRLLEESIFLQLENTFQRLLMTLLRSSYLLSEENNLNSGLTQ